MADVPAMPARPDTAACVLCDTTSSTVDLTLQVWPDGESRWQCRNFHACARGLAAGQDRRARRALHVDLDPGQGPGASPRHIQLRAARMHELLDSMGEP